MVNIQYKNVYKTEVIDMEKLSEGLKKILLAGIGTVAVTAEKSKDVLDEMVKRGELTVEQGKVLNKELKHNLKNTIKNNVNVSVKPQSGEELEELLGNMTPDQLADLKDKISQMQEKDAAEPENEEVDKDADVDDASKDADTDDTDAAEGAAEKTVTADTKSE
jgi:polyhydroxyalkanoate synthesis regulator phasin